jgi:hypothetical protein
MKLKQTLTALAVAAAAAGAAAPASAAADYSLLFQGVGKELNGGGCAGGSGGALRLCFAGMTAVAPDLSWTIDVTGGSWAIPTTGPHLKVHFGNDNTNRVGSLLSTSVPAVPEPETYALMLAGLAAVGYVARRRRSA